MHELRQMACWMEEYADLEMCYSRADVNNSSAE